MDCTEKIGVAKFNVPIGRFENPKICDEDNLRTVALALKMSICVFVILKRQSLKQKKMILFFDLLI